MAKKYHECDTDIISDINNLLNKLVFLSIYFKNFNFGWNHLWLSFSFGRLWSSRHYCNLFSA